MKTSKLLLLFLAFSSLQIQPLHLNQKTKASLGAVLYAVFATELGFLALGSATASRYSTNDTAARIFKYTALGLGACAAVSALAAVTCALHASAIMQDKDEIHIANS